MKKFLAIGVLMAALLCSGNGLFARQAQDTAYPVVLEFYSIGTGTPGKEPLQKFLAHYSKQNKLPKLQAMLVGGLGREGEYAILLPLKELSAARQKKFVSALSKALPTLKKKGESGGINMTRNQAFDTSRGRLQPAVLYL